MTTPQVSIHFVSFNQAAFVEGSLESALRQDYPNLQIIASDDGSTDGTAQIIERYARRYPDRIHAITGGPNLGITANCNRALRECKGEYIAFLAGDDLYLPGKIRAQVSWFERNSDAVLCGHQLSVRNQIANSETALTRRFTEGRGPAHWIEHGSLYGSLSIMIRSRVAPKRGFDERIPNVSDNKFWIDCLSAGERYGYLPDTFAVYIKHANNYTNDKLAASSELELAFSIIEADYPQFASECRRGRVNLIEYGRGLYELNQGRHRLALKKFLAVWIQNPRNLKTPVRIAQTIGRFLRSCAGIKPGANR